MDLAIETIATVQVIYGKDPISAQQSHSYAKNLSYK